MLCKYNDPQKRIINTETFEQFSKLLNFREEKGLYFFVAIIDKKEGIKSKVVLVFRSKWNVLTTKNNSFL